MSVEDDGLGTPNCPNCLTPMEVMGDDETLRWVCLACEFDRVTEGLQG